MFYVIRPNIEHKDANCTFYAASRCWEVKHHLRIDELTNTFCLLQTLLLVQVIVVGIKDCKGVLQLQILYDFCLQVSYSHTKII